MAKFEQNEALKTFLLNTGDRILVEASPRDRIWGIGIGQNNPDAENPYRWKEVKLLGGHQREFTSRLRPLNLLGFALMEVRRKINANK